MKKLLLLVLLLSGLGGGAMAQGPRVRLEARKILSGSFDTTLYDGTPKSLGWGVSGAVELSLGRFLYTSAGVGWRKIHHEAMSDTYSTTVDMQDLRVPINLGLRFKMLGVGLSLEGGVWGGYTLKTSGSAISPNIILDEVNQGLSSIRGLSSEDLLQGVQSLRDKPLDYGVGVSLAFEFGLLYLRGGVEHHLSKHSSLGIASPTTGFVGLGIRL